MVLSFVPLIAGIVACAAAGWILWWAYGRYESGSTKALVAIGAAVLAFVLFFVGQTLLEVMHPASRAPNGDIIAYDVHIFAIVLLVIIVALFALRHTESTSRN